MRRSVLDELRRIIPTRRLTQIEALRFAEIQAERLLEEFKISSPPVPETVITELPKIEVRRISPWPVSGSADWVRSSWIIVINGAEPMVRQRFTLAHEFKHVLDHRLADLLYQPMLEMSSAKRTETVCDYFAGCLLVPSEWLLAAWSAGHRNFSELAGEFAVSESAIYVRLQQIGLAVRKPRCQSGSPVLRIRLLSLQAPSHPTQRRPRTYRGRSQAIPSISSTPKPSLPTETKPNQTEQGVTP